MRYIVDILPAALTEIIEAAQWYEDRREGLGVDFAAEVDRAIDWLAERALTPRIRTAVRASGGFIPAASLIESAITLRTKMFMSLLSFTTLDMIAPGVTIYENRDACGCPLGLQQKEVFGFRKRDASI